MYLFATAFAKRYYKCFLRCKIEPQGRSKPADFKPSDTERSEVKRGLKSEGERRPTAQFYTEIDTSNTELQTSVANDAFLYFTGPLKLDRDSHCFEPTVEQAMSRSISALSRVRGSQKSS